MQSSTKPTLVIVHGGWHDPSCFDLVRGPLESEGYKCLVPALPSIGELSSTKTAKDDVELVQGIIKDCLSHGEDVIVIGHSNGGLKANGALGELVGEVNTVNAGRGRVLGLALIAALIPPIAKLGAPKTAPQVDRETMLPMNAVHDFYNDMPPDQAAYWTSRLRPMHSQDMPGGYYEAWRHVPVSYLVCTEDKGISASQQDAIVEAVRVEGGVVHVTRVQSGHSPFLSRPGEVAEWIKRAAQEELL